jgi:hypothetical protein
MSGLDIFLKRSIRTCVVTYKPIAPADNPAQLEFNCLGHSDFYTDLNSVRLLLHIKLVKTDGSDVTSAEPNTVDCFNNLTHSIYISRSVSLNGKSVTLHENNYYYKACHKDCSRYIDSLRAGRSRDRIPVVARFSAPVQTGSDAHPCLLYKGYRVFHGVRRPGRGVDHPPSSSAEVHRKKWSYTSNLPKGLRGL